MLQDELRLYMMVVLEVYVTSCGILEMPRYSVKVWDIKEA
jgi:hypothetical protein